MVQSLRTQRSRQSKVRSKRTMFWHRLLPKNSPVALPKSAQTLAKSVAVTDRKPPVLELRNEERRSKKVF